MENVRVKEVRNIKESCCPCKMNGVNLEFEILAKIFLLRSTSPTFSWSSGRKGYATAAKLLLLFNLGAVLFNLLSVGGEGATLINQGRLCLQILASVAEIIAVFCYMRTVKRLFMSIKEDNY